MTTAADIFRRAIQLAGSDLGFATTNGVDPLTASGGGPDTLKDLGALPPAGASKTLNRGWWLWRPNVNNPEDEERLIGEYVGSAYEYAVRGPNYTEAPLVGGDDGRYRIVRNKPSEWKAALSEALREECFFPRFDEFTPTSSTQRIYQLDAAPIAVTDTDSISQLFNIQWHPKDDATNEELWRDWADGRRTWRPFEDEGTTFIEFNGPLPGTDQELRLVWVLPFTPLADETTTSNVDELWAARATLHVMSRGLADRDNPSDSWRQTGIDSKVVIEDRRRQELGRLSYREVERSTQFIGGASVGGRGGRGVRRIGRRGFSENRDF